MAVDPGAGGGSTEGKIAVDMVVGVMGKWWKHRCGSGRGGTGCDLHVDGMTMWEQHGHERGGVGGEMTMWKSCGRRRGLWAGRGPHL